LKRALTCISVLVAASAALVSCGYNRPSSQSTTSGLKFRVFVSNPLRPTGSGNAPVLEIVDALKDKLSGFTVNLLGVSSQPGLMALSPNKRFTLVFSAVGNSIAVVDNSREAPAGSGASPSSVITLPDFTESMFVSATDMAYAAVQNAPVAGPSPGAVEVLNLSANVISATVPVPNVRYIVQSHNGNKILAFGDNQDTVTIIAPSLIGTNTDPRTVVCCFDHPVWGIFSSDDTTAYILNCGPECGGTAAGVTLLNLSTNSVGATIPVDAASTGLIQGNTLYVAGTPPGTACSSGTAAQTCGTLSVIDLVSLTVAGTAELTDGYHTRVEMGANGQLFIGARGCTNINIAPSGSNPGEIRGCLSIFNTSDSKVVVPPVNGDVTGLEPIPDRNVVYVVQGGELSIYDSTTDKLQSTQVDIIGQAVDVKVVDF